MKMSFLFWFLWVVVFPLILGVAWFILVAIVVGIKALLERRRIRRNAKRAAEMAAWHAANPGKGHTCLYTGPMNQKDL